MNDEANAEKKRGTDLRREVEALLSSQKAEVSAEPFLRGIRAAEAAYGPIIALSPDDRQWLVQELAKDASPGAHLASIFIEAHGLTGDDARFVLRILSGVLEAAGY